MYTDIYRSAALSEHRIPSFTPINSNGGNPRFINPARTITRPIDDDTGYTTSNNRNSRVNIAEKNEAAPLRVTKRRVRSIVWPADVERLADGDPPTKKPKKTQPSRSLSAKAPLSLAPFVVEETASPRSHTLPLEQPTAEGALVTDLKGKSRAKSNSKSNRALACRSVVAKQPQFKAHNVTKPLVVEKDASTLVPAHVASVSNHITTQDFVKYNSQAFVLSTKTANKLHSFLYIPPNQNTSSSTLSLQAPKPVLEIQPGQKKPTASLPSSDYGPAPSYDEVVMESSVRDPIELEADRPDGISQRQSPDLPSVCALLSSDELFPAGTIVEGRSHVAQGSGRTQIHFRNIALQTIEEPGDVEEPLQAYSNPIDHIGPGSQSEPVLHSPQNHLSITNSVFDTPDSSEARAFTRLSDHIEHVPWEESASSELPEGFDCEADALSKGVEQSHMERKGTLHKERAADITSQELFPPFTQTTTRRGLADNDLRPQFRELPEAFDDEDMLLDKPFSPGIDEFEDGPENETFLPDEPIYSDPGDSNDYDINDEVMPFDDAMPTVDEAMPLDEMIPFEFDEFDEGLDDSDMLEILAKDAMRDALDNESTHLACPIAKSIPAPDKKAQRANITPPTVPSPASSGIIVCDIDEFPMEEGDEEEMMKLPTIQVGTSNCLQPPSKPHRAKNRRSGLVEAYLNTAKLSPPKTICRTNNHSQSSPRPSAYVLSDSSPTQGSEPRSDLLGEGEEWAHRSTDRVQIIDLCDTQPLEHDDEDLSEIELIRPRLPKRLYSLRPSVRNNPAAGTSVSTLKGDPDYEPLPTFARPDFPVAIRDRCPVIGLSDQTFLRTCFKIGEMFKEGKRCSSLGRDAIIELFARVTFSSRDPGTTKQHFLFADLWQDNPPFPSGILMNYKTTGLADTESKAFVGVEEPKLVRCLGRFKRDVKSTTGWLLHIITIRETDWEEIRYTKRIVCAGEVEPAGPKLV